MKARPWLLRLLVAGLLLAALPAASAKRRKRKPTPKPTPRPTRTATPTVFYGPPAPALLRAAGSVVQVGPDSIVVAEVGQTGRMFRIDGTTGVRARLVKGGRVRVVYVETPEGPFAREILPGPEPVTPTPKPKA